MQEFLVCDPWLSLWGSFLGPLLPLQVTILFMVLFLEPGTVLGT